MDFPSCFVNIINVYLCMRLFTGRMRLADSASQNTHFCVKYCCLFLTGKKCARSKNEITLLDTDKNVVIHVILWYLGIAV